MISSRMSKPRVLLADDHGIALAGGAATTSKIGVTL